MRLPIILFSMILFFACQKAETTQDLQPGPDGWIDLIDQDLTGWEMRGNVNAEVSDGVLEVATVDENSSALLVSKSSFDHFVLDFDFLTDESEIGVLVRFNDMVRTVPENAGYLVSTDFNPDQQNPAGTVLGTARATVLEEINTDDWNNMSLEVAGSHIKVFINKQLVAEANDQRFSQGKLAIQVPRSAAKSAKFRNMRLQPLMIAAVVTELVEDRYRADTASSWISMFDGKTLEGWQPIGDGSWEVVDGAIHGYSGEEGGFLVSDEAFKDFYLKTKFKIIKEDNSGIFIRKSPDSAAVTITDAIECNIYDHNGPSHAYSTGSIATHARAWFGMIDYDDWNEMEIFAENEHIVMFVNGVKSSESYLPNKFDKAGNICLQGGIKVFDPEQGPSDIYFKEILLKSFD